MEEIVNSINSILSKLYSSIIDNGFNLLDKIAVIDSNIFKSGTLKLFVDNIDSVNAIVIALFSSLCTFFILKYILSIYSDIYVLNIYHFIIKAIFVGTICTNSIYVCTTALNFHSQLNKAIKEYLREISGENIEYKFLKEDINTLEKFFKSIKKIGIKGLKDSIVCTYIIFLIIVYSCRYVIIILCIISSPFFLLLLIDKNTSKYTFLWFNTFFKSLILENINIIIIFIPITNRKNDEIYSAILIGSMLVMYKINKKIGEITK